MVHGGVAFFKSDAALTVLSHLPGWQWTRVLRVLPKALRDAVYNLIARNRYRIFGKYEACFLGDAGFQEQGDGVKTLLVIPGCATWRRPGIHKRRSWLWIPGSRYARPGMTAVVFPNTSPAALSPQSLAPCAVEKKFGDVASPAKNNLPSTGAASTARSPAWPGRAWE